jgi:F-type H+-transporting ATPase subunit b
MSNLLIVPFLTAVEEGQRVDLLSPSGGLMLWTLLIFAVLLVILSRFAFKPILAAVEARERSLQEAIDSARRDRDEAARLLAEQRARLEEAHSEAQRLIAEGRAAADRLRQQMLEEAKQQQQEMLERARREIETERANALEDLRRGTIDLAIAAAERVIERNLDAAANREIVERFLASLDEVKEAS